MADYRSFCHSCGAETTFGSHKADCESSRRVREAEAERRRFEDSMREAMAELTDDEAVAALVELELRALALDQEAGAVRKKIMAVKEDIRYRDRGYDLMKQARKEAGYRD